MSEDLVTLMIYLALALIGIIGSAYKNKAKRRQAASGPPAPPRVPRTFQSEPAKDLEAELGPLIELFDIPRSQPEYHGYETIESGHSIEEEGMTVDTEEASEELAGMGFDSVGSAVESKVSETETFEEGQSDIQKMIAKYEAIRKELGEDGISDDIASGEIVSVEAEEQAELARRKNKVFFDARKAIIYSEILKRKEY